ncbi:helicase-related protein, partial [Salmonella sp. SAL04269]|uniref:helicase-related protein n=1 Tax=Salmonella sp. SAL04269 TaxID=3159847 RepID=UPI003978DFE3
VWPDEPGTLALHHGSLDPVLRAQVESGLRTGALRCVVSTSSLDLGVDFPAVDQVFQVGSPKGAARLLQRAGRSRHRPGEAGQV